MDYEHFVVAAARVVEFVGVAVLLFGRLLAAAAFSRRLVRCATFQDAYHALRADLGRAILLGLELLVIADIIGTVAIEPTLQNLRSARRDCGDPDTSELRTRVGSQRALAVAARTGRRPGGVGGLR